MRIPHDENGSKPQDMTVGNTPTTINLVIFNCDDAWIRRIEEYKNQIDGGDILQVLQNASGSIIRCNEIFSNDTSKYTYIPKEELFSGSYVYVDNRICVANPKYLVYEHNELHLSEVAKADIKACCITFCEATPSEEDISYDLSQTTCIVEWKDIEKDKVGIPEHLNRKVLQNAKSGNIISCATSFLDNRISSVTEENFSKHLLYVKKRHNNPSYDAIAAYLNRSSSGFQQKKNRVLASDKERFELDEMIKICVFLNLDIMESIDLIRKANVNLDPTKSIQIHLITKNLLRPVQSNN